MIVVDASAALEVLLNGPLAPRASASLFDSGESLHAPHLIDVEVTQVLRRLARRGEITVARAEGALQDLAGLPLARYPQLMLISRAWSLRDNVTAYDAMYLALAEVLGATLVTCDGALATVPAHGARVEAIR